MGSRLPKQAASLSAHIILSSFTLRKASVYHPAHIRGAIAWEMCAVMLVWACPALQDTVLSGKVRRDYARFSIFFCSISMDCKASVLLPVVDRMENAMFTI